METIQEDEEFSMETKSSPISEEELHYSADQDSSFDRIHKTKISRKKKKLVIARIQMQQKNRKKTKEEPPKWICTVKGCKWGGRYHALFLTHIKTCHPQLDTSKNLKPYSSNTSNNPKTFTDAGDYWPPPLERKKEEEFVKKGHTAQGNTRNMEEEEIDVVNYEPDALRAAANNEIDTEIPFQCPHCNWVGRSARSLSGHRRQKHPNRQEESFKRPKGRPRKPISTIDEEHLGPQDDGTGGYQPQIPQQRVTTKELLGGRKRPKTVVENPDESALRTDREASRLHQMGMIDEEMPVGEYVAKRTNGAFAVETHVDDEGASIIVGDEIEIDGEVTVGGEIVNDGDQIPLENRPYKPYYPRTVARNNVKKGKYNQAGTLPARLVTSDPEGKYKCYIKDCNWQGNYRSLRMEHMKAVHPSWKMPPRFLLERISKHGEYIDPEKWKPEIPCLVEGCEWRGNYRASRSAHMRKVHPEEHAAKKKKQPGYDCNGTYMCHYPMCTWRGWSRSTRSMHIKKVHPEWRPDDMRTTVLLTCFYCKNSLPSYPQLEGHIDQDHGGLGLEVHEEFLSKEEFGLWLQRVERSFSISFERSDPISQAQDVVHYTLHCNCVGERGVQLASDTRSYIYEKHNFLKRRNQQYLTRSKSDCSAHLEVSEHVRYTQIIVKGTLEHTGHRFGTPLLRFSHTERQLYGDILIWEREDRDFKLSALEMVERLNKYEGFTMEGYGPPTELRMITPLHDDPLISLRMIIEQSDLSCFFGIDYSRFEHRDIAFGYMSPEMQRNWERYGPERVAIIDRSAIDFDTCELFVYSVMVTDDNFIPKCCLIYVTTFEQNACEIVLEQLKSIDSRGPRELMVDPSEVWVHAAEKIWSPEETAVLITEWSLIDYWASKTEQLVPNEFDVFSIVSALRRMVRSEDIHIFLFYVIEMFETLFECGYEDLADFFDCQLSDIDFFKRWSPFHRSALATHAHPTLGVASRNLREAYLGNDRIDRPDLWFAHATMRVSDYNSVEATQTYTLRPVEDPKKFCYNTIDVSEFHKEVHEQDAETVLMYEEEVQMEEFVEGDVVEEEVIGHELTDEAGRHIMYENVMMKDGQTLLRRTLPPIRQLNQMPPNPQMRMYEKEAEEIQLEEEIIHMEDMEVVEHLEQEEDPDEPGCSSSLVQHSQNSGLPRHLADMLDKHESVDMDDSPSPPLRRSKRDTTKSVIRGGRKKKDRFADLRDCPPEVMRAIAAHAIAYDGRKKEQQPFMLVPSLAEMAQSATPTVPTPDLSEYNSMSARRFTPQQSEHARKLQRAAMERRLDRRRQEEEEEQLEMEQGQSTSSSMHHHHHGYVDEEEEEIPIDEMEDDQQPCSSSSLYR
ncbi:unnamed protein product [Caenorhabditis sp. 36 PRJEB53466]|nr:unnamed protein product [Caenorhabditis sp. 36 PRJEB53466]